MKKHISMADSIAYTKSDSAIKIYKSIYAKAIKNKDTISTIQCLLKMGDIQFNQMKLSDALDLISEALYLSDNKNLPTPKAKAHAALAKIHSRYGDIKTGEAYVLESHEMIKKEVANGNANQLDLLKSYQDIIQVVRRIRTNSEIEAYVDSCFHIAENLNLNKIKQINLYRLRSGLLIQDGNLTEALQILLPLEQLCDSIYAANGKITSEIHQITLIKVNIARAFKMQQQFSRAKRYYVKALKLSDKNKNQNVFRPFVLAELADTYNKLQKSDLAYVYLMESKKLELEYFKSTSERNLGALKIRDSFKEKLEQQEKELLERNLRLIEKDQAILRFRIFFLLTLMSIVAAFLIVRNRNQKHRYQNEQKLLKQKSEEKEKISQLKIQHKNKELTSYSLQLMERDDLLDKFAEFIKGKDKGKEAKSLIVSRKQLTLDNWEEFEKRFVSINEGYYERISQKFPDLTIQDLKYCALLKLNLKGKEISKLLGVAENSVHMARYRIRKKCCLKTDANLVEFLNRV